MLFSYLYFWSSVTRYTESCSVGFVLEKATAVTGDCTCTCTIRSAVGTVTFGKRVPCTLGSTVATSETWSCDSVPWEANLSNASPWPQKPAESGCVRLCQPPLPLWLLRHSLSHCLLNPERGQIATKETSERGGQGWLPVTHHSWNRPEGMRLFTPCFRKGWRVQVVPHAYRRLRRLHGFLIPCSWHLPTFTFLVHAQPGRHGSLACSTTSLLPKPQGSFTTPVPQQELEGLSGEGEFLFPEKYLFWGGWHQHQLSKGKLLFSKTGSILGNKHIKVLPCLRSWYWSVSVLQGFTAPSVPTPGWHFTACSVLQPWQACRMVTLKVLGVRGASALLCSFPMASLT